MKKLLSLLLTLALLLSVGLASAESAATAPKYVFMFIGDGQGSPQITAAQYYLGTTQNPDAVMPTPAQLSFTNFSSLGLMTTFDATSFCPDSASTATSMVSGEKTLSGVLNYNVDKTESFKLITEYAKEAGKKVGVITTVSLDHATPAAYYAKAPSRSQYYDIAVQGLTGKTLDFLGGGSFLQPKGKENDKQDLMEIAASNGWTVIRKADEIRAINGDSGRVLAMVEDVDGSQAMQYEIDRLKKIADGQDSLSLAEMVKAGIANLVSDNGFFLMTEGGKIDWACHANDAITSIYDTLAFSDAVQVAIDFAAQHPEETLIIVTGDHETGGMTIGFAATAYDTHFNYLQNAKVSYQEFDKVIADMRANKVSFEDALKTIESYYGLTTAADKPLTLSGTELAALKAAFELSMIAKDARQLGDAEALAYGGYEPLSVTITHIFNNKAGIAYTSYAHTGLQIPVYAAGVNASLFGGQYDNTQIFFKTMEAMGLKQ
jgi:alkaline phosphatase